MGFNLLSSSHRLAGRYFRGLHITHSQRNGTDVVDLGGENNSLSDFLLGRKFIAQCKVDSVFFIKP